MNKDFLDLSQLNGQAGTPANVIIPDEHYKMMAQQAVEQYRSSGLELYVSITVIKDTLIEKNLVTPEEFTDKFEKTYISFLEEQVKAVDQDIARMKVSKAPGSHNELKLRRYIKDEYVALINKIKKNVNEEKQEESKTDKQKSVEEVNVLRTEE